MSYSSSSSIVVQKMQRFWMVVIVVAASFAVEQTDAQAYGSGWTVGDLGESCDATCGESATCNSGPMTYLNNGMKATFVISFPQVADTPVTSVAPGDDVNYLPAITDETLFFQSGVDSSCDAVTAFPFQRLCCCIPNAGGDKYILCPLNGNLSPSGAPSESAAPSATPSASPSAAPSVTPSASPTGKKGKSGGGKKGSKSPSSPDSIGKKGGSNNPSGPTGKSSVSDGTRRTLFGKVDN
jgi:hypothetical protein